MQYFLGVASGSTVADFLLGDETRELDCVRTGTIKRKKVSDETTEANARSRSTRAVRPAELAVQSLCF